ncbi:MAG TPA: tail fiber protein [Burkholderiaceae bacterium]
MEVYIASIIPFGFNFAPSGWQMCAGQTVGISQYQAVFALIGTFYGGNGTSNFQLPDLRGRVPISMGQGLGLPTYVIGENGGAYQESLTLQNLPQHNHPATFTPSGGGSVSVTIKASSVAPATGSNWATAPSSSNNILAASATGGQLAAGIWAPSSTTPDTPIGGVTASGGGGGGTVAVGMTGSSLPINLMNPYLALNFCFAMNGIFPSRN